MLSWNSRLLRFSPLHLMVEDSYVFLSLNTRPRCNPRAEFILLSWNMHISFVVSSNPPVIFIGNTHGSQLCSIPYLYVGAQKTEKNYCIRLFSVHFAPVFKTFAHTWWCVRFCLCSDK